VGRLSSIYRVRRPSHALQGQCRGEIVGRAGGERMKNGDTAYGNCIMEQVEPEFRMIVLYVSCELLVSTAEYGVSRHRIPHYESLPS
jgi:hypothetical protein